MRIFKGQINLDGVPLATLQAMATALQTAYNNRLLGNGNATTASEEIEIAGLVLKAVKLEELLEQIGEVNNAIQKLTLGRAATFSEGSFGDSWGGWRCSIPPPGQF